MNYPFLWDDFGQNGGFCMGDTLVVRGGQSLYGTVETPAAKNSVLPLLAASLLCRQPVQLHALPQLSDVAHAVTILQAVGAQTRQQGRTLTVQAQQLSGCLLPDEAVMQMRASVLFLAPVLARAGQAGAVLPGGCRLGPRPVDLHLAGLQALGAQLRCEGDRLWLSAPQGLRGAGFTLRLPSVGATETMLLAAATAQGTTVLRGAACEPEIVDLAAFLNACGARITGAGTPEICIRGVPQLGGASFTPLPDRIVAATLACAVASAGGQAVIRRCVPQHLAPVLQVLRQAGCRVRQTGPQELTVERTGPLQGVGTVRTGAYPAFPTDAAPLVAAALLWAGGESRVEETIFARRFACAEGFAAMGARTRLDGGTLVLSPGGWRQGARVTAPDLRGGAALAVAALAVPAPVRVQNASVLARGYEDLPALLRQLGARADLLC